MSKALEEINKSQVLLAKEPFDNEKLINIDSFTSLTTGGCQPELMKEGFKKPPPSRQLKTTPIAKKRESPRLESAGMKRSESQVSLTLSTGPVMNLPHALGAMPSYMKKHLKDVEKASTPTTTSIAPRPISRAPSNLQREPDVLTTVDPNQQISDLKAQVRKFCTKDIEDRRRLQDASKTIEGLRAKLTAAESLNAKKETELEEKNKRIQALDVLVLRQKRDCKKSAASSNENTEKLQSLVNQIESLNQTVEEKDKELKAKEATYQKLNMEVKRLKLDLEKKSKMSESLSMEKARVEQMLSDQQENLRSEKDSNRDEELKKMVQDLEVQLKQRDDVIYELKRNSDRLIDGNVRVLVRS